MAIRALVFDVFGTLVDWRTSVAAALERLGRERNVACDWFAFVDAWRLAYVPSMESVRNGTRPWANLDELQAESFDRLTERFELPPFAADDRARAVRAWHALEPWPDVPAALERLRARRTLATLSNGGFELLVNLARHAGLRFDAILSAEIFRHYKPDPETYLGAAQLLGCAPAETMLVAAHEIDLRAAARCGLRTAFIRRPLEYGPGRAVAPMPEGFDYAVADLDALAVALEETASLGTAPSKVMPPSVRPITT